MFIMLLLHVRVNLNLIYQRKHIFVEWTPLWFHHYIFKAVSFSLLDSVSQMTAKDHMYDFMPGGIDFDLQNALNIRDIR